LVLNVKFVVNRLESFKAMGRFWRCQWKETSYLCSMSYDVTFTIMVGIWNGCYFWNNGQLCVHSTL